MELMDVIYNCRAMRKLDTRPVEDELLIKLVDAANQAHLARTCKTAGGLS